MNKHITISLISVLAVFAQSCAPTTAVRVLSLSYEGQPEAQPINNTEKLANRFNGPKRADEEIYIFPGDILTFTVELEDPNFEFISLLAIKFNGQTIRANSDDSIVTTRDCGANICVDFPFEIQSGVTQYQVEEVKFAKLSSESGVNAIIDNRSLSKIILNNLWDEKIYPKVTTSVNNINELINSLEFKDINELISMFQESTDYKTLIQSLVKQRTLKIMNPSHDVIGDPNIGLSSRKINFPSALDSANVVPGNVLSQIQNIQLIELFSGSDSEFVGSFSALDYDFEEYLGSYSSIVNTNIYFGILDNTFSDAVAFNKGKYIYLLLNEEELFLYRMGRDTYIISY